MGTYMQVKLTSSLSHRHVTIDLLRAIAITLMLTFHFCYDLQFLSIVNLGIPNSTGWREFRAIIVSLFLITMGASLKLAYPQNLNWRRFSAKLFTLAVSALLISLASLVVINANWIFFGIIHFILLATALAVGFRHSPKLSFVIATTIIIIDYLTLLPNKWPFNYIDSLLPVKTNDFVAIFPWLALPFIGITLAHQGFIINDPCRAMKLPNCIKWLSQHSLMIYLLHQPIFLGICYGYKQYVSH